MDNLGQAQEQDLTLEKLTPEQKQKVEAIAADIDINDSQAIIQYGVGSQSNISNFADTILEQVRAKDAGYAGEILTDLMITVKDLKVDKLGSSGGFLSKIPIIGGIVDEAKKFVGRYQKVSVEIERIVDELTKARMQLLKDITMLDSLYEKNQEYLRELDLFIIAGEIKMKEINDKLLPEIKAKAAESKDTLDAQAVHDLTQMINRFEKKIHDLKLSRMVAIQTMPQVRLIQNNDQVLVEKIQSSILNTIPLWKNQIVIAISLFRQKKALKLQKEVSETTNDLLEQNAALLKDSSLDIARESEKGIVEIDTLKKVHENLISTIEETLKIQEEGKTKRKEAEVELVKLEDDLKAKLSSVQSAENTPAQL